MWRLLPYLIFWFLGILFGSIGGYYYFFYKQLLQEGKTVKGVVMLHYHGRGERFAPIIDYTIEGKRLVHEHQPAIRGGKELYPLRSTVELLYIPGDPERVALKSVVDTQWLFYVFYGSILLFLLIPLLIFIYTRFK
ncbi:hypothetical protein SanaruYs_09250 [Chryseotalea sanaruensis]|uniref:DUF3592 domain-containing protein n=1 Tax=Chryseotalea sanaruensis TaxID=2482724 RepID=A0A401U733_9BACT|nr:DUF3592 domain-containing protein [Chryseotalea sanaruensis]GCC50707.1 hypothetical protein SanaruYs_09250 [Chryseotalea sanaruensis]